MNDLLTDFNNWAKTQNINVRKNEIIEFYEPINTLLNEGFTLSSIYRYLTDRQHIKCSYQTFCRHVSNIQKENEQAAKQQ